MIAKGEVLSVQQVWEWGKIWYEGRLELGWRRRTVAQMEAVFEQLGFSGPFWSLR
jgi:hypothetical protein